MTISKPAEKSSTQIGECPVPRLKEAVQNIKVKRSKKISYYRILKDILANLALKG